MMEFNLFIRFYPTSYELTINMQDPIESFYTPAWLTATTAMAGVAKNDREETRVRDIIRIFRQH